MQVLTSRLPNLARRVLSTLGSQNFAEFGGHEGVYKGLGFRVYKGLGFRVYKGLGFRVYKGLGFRVQGYRGAA